MSQNIGATEKELIEFRKAKLKALYDKGINPYPSKSERDHSAKSIHEKREELINDNSNVIVAGRIMARRGHGKLAFVDLSDESAKIQVVFKADVLGEDKFDLLDLTDLGDFIEVSGTVFVTNAGETSIEVHDFKILDKSLKPLPDKRHGLVDEEIRFRKRYLELAIDPELRELFKKKARFWQSTREFLVSKEFLEVETPVLETTPGGADASPFQTHHDALDIDVYLRISMGELWQKRLMVGGFEKTFEIGRQFRNEGISREHLQDYSQMEFYWAYANYEDSMVLVHDLYQHIAMETFGTYQFKIGQFDVDFEGEWPKIDYVETIKEKLGIDVLESSDEELLDKVKELHLKLEDGINRARIIDTLWKKIRKEIAGPVFLVNHPVEVSPLAKRKEDNPRLVERYQVILAGSEMGNGYSELNDPIDQAERFSEQARLREEGDTEAQMHDQDFVEALEYGMPPTTGFGFSERLFSFLIDKSAREAQLFPLMKPKESSISGKKRMEKAAVILNNSAGLSKWQEYNTVAHLSASFAGRIGMSLFSEDKIRTKDDFELSLNIKNGIVIKEVNSNSDLIKLMTDSKNSGLDIFEFTREMLETTNDSKIIDSTSEKNMDEIEFLGVLVFGDKNEVDELTNQFKLKE